MLFDIKCMRVLKLNKSNKKQQNKIEKTAIKDTYIPCIIYFCFVSNKIQKIDILQYFFNQKDTYMRLGLK